MRVAARVTQPCQRYCRTRVGLARRRQSILQLRMPSCDPVRSLPSWSRLGVPGGGWPHLLRTPPSLLPPGSPRSAGRPPSRSSQPRRDVPPRWCAPQRARACGSGRSGGRGARPPCGGSPRTAHRAARESCPARTAPPTHRPRRRSEVFESSQLHAPPDPESRSPGAQRAVRYVRRHPETGEKPRCSGPGRGAQTLGAGAPDAHGSTPCHRRISPRRSVPGAETPSPPRLGRVGVRGAHPAPRQTRPHNRHCTGGHGSAAPG